MNKNRATLSGGSLSLCRRRARGEQLEAAWRLIRYLTSEEPQLTLGVEMGVIPANRHAAVHPDFMDDEIKRVFIESVHTRGSAPTTRLTRVSRAFCKGLCRAPS